METRRRCRVRNRDGFHARTCTAIALLAKRHKGQVRIAKGEQEADGTSVFDLMLLNVACGEEVEVRAAGADAAALAKAVADLIESGFGEELG
jgi:phosphocarrier protein